MRLPSLFFPAGLLVFLPACAQVPPATREEIKLRDDWAARVFPPVRQQVIEDADRHTNWGEKRKIQYEIERYQHAYRDQQHKARTTQPSTKAITRP